jgi:hypothetical protein
MRTRVPVFAHTPASGMPPLDDPLEDPPDELPPLDEPVPLDEPDIPDELPPPELPPGEPSTELAGVDPVEHAPLRHGLATSNARYAVVTVILEFEIRMFCSRSSHHASGRLT